MKAGRSLAISSVAVFTLSKPDSVFGGKTSWDKERVLRASNSVIFMETPQFLCFCPLYTRENGKSSRKRYKKIRRISSFWLTGENDCDTIE
jgi:hypothetical protein